MEPDHSVSNLLERWNQGEAEALDELMPLIYEQLRKMARRYMNQQSPGHTLQTTALIHEAYLRMVKQKEKQFQNRAHFFGVAAQAMRHEQARGNGKDIDQRSDIFSFGCILFEASARRRAFDGKNPLDSIHKIVDALTPLIKDTNPEAPDELQRIVRHCLAKDPEERYQTINDVAQELREVRQGMTGPGVATFNRQPSGPATVTTSSAEYLASHLRGHKRVALIAWAVFIAATAVLIYFSYFTTRSAPPLTEQDTHPDRGFRQQDRR